MSSMPQLVVKLWNASVTHVTHSSVSFQVLFIETYETWGCVKTYNQLPKLEELTPLISYFSVPRVPGL